MLTSAQIAALKADFTGGVLAAMLAPMLLDIVGHDTEDDNIAAAYNTVSTTPVTLSSADKGSIAAVASLAVGNIMLASPTLQAKWLAIAPTLATLLEAADQYVPQANVGVFAALVADGLLTSDQAASPWTRMGTYIELLPAFGVGFVLTPQNVGEARNG